jgi:ABC-type transporter Mla subunit MlaD
MRRVAALLLTAAACAAALALTAAGGGSSERTYKIVFTSAFGIVEGGDFRVAGVRVGQTKKMKVRERPGKAPLAEVTAVIEKPGFELRTDASCEVDQQSLVGEYYLNCRVGDAPEEIPDGGEVPVERTTPTIPGDIVLNILRQPVRERLRLLLNELGATAAGRPQTIQRIVRRGQPTLEEATKALDVLRRENRSIERFIRDADTTVAALAADRRDVRRFIDESGETAELFASRREALALGVRRLPEFLAELEPTAARLDELSQAGVPLLRRVRESAPALEELLVRTQPFARAGRPALRALGEASDAGSDVLEAGRRELRVLRDLAGDAPGAARPLRQFLQTLDDRRRAIDHDPRAKVGGPPPSDPSYGGGRGGFTGFESLANYFFWQSMTINQFDSIGHLLRVGTRVNECTPFHNEPPRTPEDEALFKRCNSWLGPNQPGITTPDPPGTTPVGGGAGAGGAKRARTQVGGAEALDFLLGP